MSRRLVWLLLPLSALLIDWASKAWILARLREGESMVVIRGCFNLTLGYNPGAIFGSLGNLPEKLRLALFALAGVGALAYFGWEFLKAETPRLQRIALGLILGGALGNGLDRLRHGAVVDFLDFYIRNWNLGFTRIREWHYWIFNLADSFIVCGVILMAWGLLSAWSRERKKTA